MATDAVNLNPHYQSARRHPDAASSEFVFASYLLAVLVPVVGFFMGFALLFKRREGHGPAVMVVAVFASIVLGLIYLDAIASDLNIGFDSVTACLDRAETVADLDACREID